MNRQQLVAAALLGFAAVAWLTFLEEPTRRNLVRALLRTSALG